MLWKNTNNINTEIELVKRDENAILFAIDKNNELTIRISSQLLSHKDAQKMAEVLYNLGKGSYQLQIVQMLTEAAKEDVGRREYVNAVLRYWALYIDNDNGQSYNNENGPVVRPTQFFETVRGSIGKNDG